MKRFAFELLDQAKKCGADAADVYIYAESGIQASIFNNELDKFERFGARGAGLRVIKNGKVGYSYSETYTDAKKITEAAIANAKIADKDEHADIAKEPITYQSEDNAPDLQPKQIIDAAKTLYEKITSMENVSSVQACDAQASYRRILVANTNGLVASHAMPLAFLIAQPVVKKGEWVNSGFWFDAKKNIDELNADYVATESVKRAMQYYGAARMKSGRPAVLFAGEAVTDLLAAFSPALSAKRADVGLSLLKGKENTKIASDKITLVDDPLNSLFKTPFDAEGTICKRKEIISDGVLTTLLHNISTANKANTVSTGNAHRSYNSTVEIAPTNFVVQQGTKTFDELLKTLANGVIIQEVSGLHAGANAVSGDFSLLAKGFEVKNGEITRPIEQIVVSGNFIAMLSSVQEVGNDTFYGIPGTQSYASPSLLVGEMSIAGG